MTEYTVYQVSHNDDDDDNDSDDDLLTDWSFVSFFGSQTVHAL